MAALLFFTASLAQSNRVFIMVQTRKSNGAKCDPAALKAKLLTDLFNALQRKYPCSSFTADSDIAALLNWERQRQLLGSDDSDGLWMAAIAGGKLSLQIGSSPARITTSASGVHVSIPPEDTSIDGGSFDDLPAQSSPNSQSGSWSKTIGGVSTTVSWSLKAK
jgi:hypothetical protein